jgi:uncharacterized membrane protein (DUF373 family)
MKEKIIKLFRDCEPQVIFRKFMQYLINVLVAYIMLVLSIGLIRTLLGIKNFFVNMPIGQTFNTVVTEILTFLVIIELFRSFIDYFEAHRFRLNTMIDPAIMFVIRELIVKLYDNQGISWQGLSGFGFLIVCLGIVRTLAVRFSPGEEDHYKIG